MDGGDQCVVAGAVAQQPGRGRGLGGLLGRGVDHGVPVPALDQPRQVLGRVAVAAYGLDAGQVGGRAAAVEGGDLVAPGEGLGGERPSQEG